MAEITPFECCVLAVLVFGCAIPVIVTAWAIVRVNLRLSQSNDLQLASILSLTQAPQATALARDIVNGTQEDARSPKKMHMRMAGN